MGLRTQDYDELGFTNDFSRKFITLKFKQQILKIFRNGAAIIRE